ncbi:hypothetical protein [Pseudonocardia endophytica]|uniref:Uncharacterized protein n=1 Tax=Pseudonocardia endophytica TaxID=401976 RepID=A0A4R1HHZ9_PSEEN|nr:hypothetical protein [Pseudonocardia endophytica]TCK21884.1 hypothetical protein EV378_5876 [Pseudonocardia endophytica]
MTPQPPTADVLFAHDGGRHEPGPPDVELQRRARSLGRPFWLSKPAGIAGAVVAGIGFVLAPTSAPGIALMVVGFAAVVASFVVLRLVGPRYGAATQVAGLPVPADRAEELGAVARAFESVLGEIEKAAETGLHPPRTKRFHTMTRRWDRATDRLRGQWLDGDDVAWRATTDRLVSCGETVEAFRRDVADHVARSASDDG